MQDSSPFRWLEERGPACQLIAVIDDATSRFYARFTEHDTTEENLRTFGEWLRRYGRPLAHYTDKNSIFRTVCSGAAGGTVAGRKSTLAFWTSAGGVGDRMDCSTQSAGERTDRATVRNAAGPLGKGNAPGGDRQHRCRESFFRDAFSSGVGRAFHGGTPQAAQCTPTVGSRTAAGGNSKRARGSPGSRRSHRQLGWKPLGRATRRSLRRSSGCTGGNRTTTGWLALATLPRPLSPPAPLPSTPATVRKSFRPTACRTRGTKSRNQKTKSNPNTMCLPITLEETMEPDISILRKTGHFYFALTDESEGRIQDRGH